MKSVLGGFGLVAGATYPLRALITFQRNPRLWQYVVVPILLNLAIASYPPSQEVLKLHDSI
jgi:CysZ protein